jgi:hypothetical protein
VKELEGDWRVERLGGFLPPMIGVRKRIRGDRGETWIGPLPGWPFRVERREGRVALIYRLPFPMLVDELWAGGRSSYRLPGKLAGWTAVRDLKPVPEQTFREWWKRERGVG